MARFVNADSKRGREIHMYCKQPSAFQYELSPIILPADVPYSNVSQPPGPGINCTGPREVLLEFVILIFQAFFMNKLFIVEIF